MEMLMFVWVNSQCDQNCVAVLPHCLKSPETRDGNLGHLWGRKNCNIIYDQLLNGFVSFSQTQYWYTCCFA